MTLLLFPAVVWVAACWGVAAHRSSVRREDEADYEALKPAPHIWARTFYRHLDQQRRAWNAARALTNLFTGWVR